MMKNFSFRQFQRTSDSKEPEGEGEGEGNVKDKDSLAYHKRREQVRKAQRTHRERKESYIKSLETQVLQRRSNEARILEEQIKLNAEIARLKRILDRNGLVYDASQGVEHASTDGSSWTATSAALSDVSVGIMTSPFHAQQMHICSPSNSSGSQFAFGDSVSESSPSGHGVAGGKQKQKQKHGFFKSRGRANTLEEANRVRSTTPLAKHVRDLDQTNLGMEFVLTLEAPCLHHTQHTATEAHLPTGHALTATAPLLFQSPTQPVNTSTTKFPPWETPHLGLEKLLSLSFNFELQDGEVTPVQAWQQLREHPEFGGLEIARLRELVGELGKGAKCHGFGAVIETDTLSALMRGLFSGGGRDFSFGFE
ncbi:hypothetical protein K504DRAFT_427344 [Pleomassaria siparia CBS 279.74]|uniref:BZIP domain-containing protein n=1 Tax=Pleomassaria siparia CBS 279.74 TaxID=1314801 RepID=A0A6G1KIT9_9PLEO|nr:hypothetical protein K504DRAFT_427344 [Pleomassaria siparia CBS 279.74]